MGTGRNLEKNVKRIMRLVTLLCPYWLLCTLTATNPTPSTSHIPNTHHNVGKGMLAGVLTFMTLDYTCLVQ
jgi:hypothetical protein